MAKIVIAGAGIVGIGTGLVLAKTGHNVTILERDRGEAPTDPEEIWTRWERKGVNQFRLPHFLLARYRGLLDAELPEVIPALVEKGALRFHPLQNLPRSLRVTGNEQSLSFDCISGRRPVVEAAVASVANHSARLDVRRGAAVTGLVAGASAHRHVPHVVGVRLESGEEITADLVIDMAGRRSPLPRWLDSIGGRPSNEEIEECGFIYYGRHFRARNGRVPSACGALLMPLGTISALTLPADNGTWSVALVTSAKDKALRRLRDATVWENTVRSLPLVAHWLDGEPIDERVATVARIEDRLRSLVTDGAPIATGIVSVGDAWACTNPTAGRGISIGMMQGVLLRDVIAEIGLDDPWKFARVFHEATAEVIEPWYRETLTADRHRLAEIDALIDGEFYRPRDPTWEFAQSLAMAARRDPDCLSAFTLVAMGLNLRSEVMERPGLAERVGELGADWRDHPIPGPDRHQLLSIVAST